MAIDDNFKRLLDFQLQERKLKECLRFIRESNAIENIHRDPTADEINEFHRFMKLKKITYLQLSKFVAVYQPDATIRDKKGLDVRVGDNTPPAGSPDIVNELKRLLKKINEATPYSFHVEYETLHPYTDCNGRSGRMLWAWMMKEVPTGFLQDFYYQSLDASRNQAKANN